MRIGHAWPKLVRIASKDSRLGKQHILGQLGEPIASPHIAPARKRHYNRAEQPVATENRRFTGATAPSTLRLARLKWLFTTRCIQGYRGIAPEWHDEVPHLYRLYGDDAVARSAQHTQLTFGTVGMYGGYIEATQE
jgi:hypothetical protein